MVGFAPSSMLFYQLVPISPKMNMSPILIPIQQAPASHIPIH